MLIKKVFPLMFVMAMVGCSSEPIDYSAIIDEYESEMANIEAENAIAFATDLAQQSHPDVRLPTFMDQPIPSHYKNYHKGLGIDVSKLNYSDSRWVADIRKDDKKVAEYNLAHPNEDHGHVH